MCGIIGGLDPQDAPVSSEERIRLRDLMTHRGPDDAGLWESGDRTWWFGHRRLSILDLTPSGHQPMGTPDGRFWITYNGEMYTFQALGGELRAAGIAIQGRSDTEVVLKALAHWGTPALDRLRGMFAFGFLDLQRDELWLVRDRLGKKPLYYWVSEDRRRFRFASELKALAEDPLVSPVLDPLSVDDFLAFQYIPSPGTIYKGVHKLRAGHRLVVRRGKDGRVALEELPYWRLRFDPDFRMSRESALEELEARLREAVEIRLVSDVPLGAFLSGGVDSSTVVALMAKRVGQPIKTYTIGFDEAEYSEQHFAQQVARHIGSEHHERILRPDAIDLLPKLVAQYDEPFGDSSALPTYLVSQFARESVTVCLSGDGGDEVFAGYDSYTAMQKAERMEWVPRPVWRLLASVMPAHNVYYKRFHLMALDAGRRFTELTGIFPSWERPSLYNSAFREALRDARGRADLPEPVDRFLPFFQAPPCSATLLDRAVNQDLHAYLTEDILVKVDRASMLNSLEVRVPILDHPLVEFAARVPAHIRQAGGEPKHLLKSLARRLVPPEVIDRPKKGFGVPLKPWFRGKLVPYAREMLLGPEGASRALLDPRAVAFVIDRHQRGGRDFNHQIWQLLVLEHWCRQHPTALREVIAPEARKSERGASVLSGVS